MIQNSSTSLRDLRAEALRALIALHNQAPFDVFELAALLDLGADACAAAMLERGARAPCMPCVVKRETACLLRAVARLRELTDVDLDDGTRA